jgi:hypothetical protein
MDVLPKILEHGLLAVALPPEGILEWKHEHGDWGVWVHYTEDDHDSCTITKQGEVYAISALYLQDDADGDSPLRSFYAFPSAPSLDTAKLMFELHVACRWPSYEGARQAQKERKARREEHQRKLDEFKKD